MAIAIGRRARLRATGIVVGVLGLVQVGGCAAPSGLRITTIAVAGAAGSAQVRQGAGEVTIVVSGTGLEDATALQVGEFVADTVNASTTGVTGVIDVVHAALVGGRTVLVTTPTGSVSRANAIVVTAITAAPSGSDDGGLGTPDAPFRTLTHSVSMAATGDTIELLDGDYDVVTAGETFPIDVSGLTVRGESRDGTTIVGLPSEGGDGLRINAGTSVVRDLTIRDFGEDGVDIQGGVVTIEGVRVQGSGVGVLVGDRNALSRPEVVLDAAVITENLGDGILVHDADVVIRGSVVSANGDDNVDVEAEADVTIEASTLAAAGDNNLEIGGDEVGGGHWFDQPSVAILGSTLTGGRDGVNVDSFADVSIVATTVTAADRDNVRVRGTASLSIVDSVLEDAGDDGIDFASTGSLFVRRAIIRDNGDDGIDIGASPSAIDLGSPNDLGGNLVVNNVEYELTDERPDYETVTVFAYGNDFGISVSGLKVGPDEDDDDEELVWRIVGEENMIHFGP